jgi:ABC-type transporter MlaC component
MSSANVLVTVSEPSQSAAEKSFRLLALRILNAVRHSDWQDFVQYAADKVAVEQYTRAYLQYYSARHKQRAFTSDLFTEVDIGNEQVSCYTMVSTLIETSKSVSRRERTYFTRFCRLVKETYTPNLAYIHVGLDVKDDEMKEKSGPSIVGHYASNVNWRIELEKNSGKWRVCKLVITTH